MAQPAKRVLVPIANGIEEMEAVILVDVLRRASAEVTVASVEDSLAITASRSVKLSGDCLIRDCRGDYDLIALPVYTFGNPALSYTKFAPVDCTLSEHVYDGGGMPGAERLRDCEKLVEMLSAQKASGRLYAAICASPAVVFETHGLLSGKKATSHPAFSSKLGNQSCVEERVVVDGTCTTSRGPGTAFEFALNLTAQLYGAEKAREVAGPMVMYVGALDSVKALV